MNKNRYDIFISYKRKSLPTANNLYYRLTTRGYSTFFDLEEMGRDNFNVQLLNYIENAKDVFVILEEGSLDGCKQDNWEEKDWFCHEIAFALEKKKNIIPILLNGYKMPSEDFFPEKLKELSLKNALEFNFSFFEAYLDKLVEKEYLLSKPNLQDKATSVFKFYSNENCQVFKEGKLVCSLEGMSDEPYYLPVPRKGDYRFKAVNTSTQESRIVDERIDEAEVKKVEVLWNRSRKSAEALLNKRKGCIISICILFTLLILVLTFGLKYTPFSKEWGSRPSSTAIDTICTPIDLGLPSGTLWGDRNVGAKHIYDFGNYYSWGEVVSIEDKIAEKNDSKITPINISGTSYDAASIELGKSWALPTGEQFAELISSCSWEWDNTDNHSGYMITGPNGNQLFLPAAGCIFKEGYRYYNQFGYYWTGDRHERTNSMAKVLIIGIGEINLEFGKKYVGRSVRAVYTKEDVIGK